MGKVPGINLKVLSSICLDQVTSALPLSHDNQTATCPQQSSIMYCTGGTEVPQAHLSLFEGLAPRLIFVWLFKIFSLLAN